MQEQLRSIVCERPMMAMLAGGTLGVALGGVVLSRLGRLAFVAALGYLAHEMWHRESRLDVVAVIDRFAR